jgi:lactoylglutathione lyase
MIEDPRINFAISTRAGCGTGINHLGLQVDTDEELKGMRAQLAAADAALVEENAVSCCYAKSDKYWVTDPQGIAWETWHNLGSVPMFGDNREALRTSPRTSGCCAPTAPERRVPPMD